MFPARHFKRVAEEDETGIGVFEPSAGLSLKSQLKTSTQELSRVSGCMKELDITRQSGVVREQMPQGDLSRVVTGLPASDKPR
jgi:DICT domain-containing protein